VADERFPISFGALRPLFVVLGLLPRLSYVERRGDELWVRMGWAFSSHFPVAAIASIAPYTGTVGGIGVHGFGGRWLVNGSASNIVAVTLSTPHRAYVLGFPVRLSELRLSLETPQRFISACGPLAT
jgi:hypothetical protein